METASESSLGARHNTTRIRVPSHDLTHPQNSRRRVCTCCLHFTDKASRVGELRPHTPGDAVGKHEKQGTSLVHARPASPKSCTDTEHAGLLLGALLVAHAPSEHPQNQWSKKSEQQNDGNTCAGLAQRPGTTSQRKR